MTARSRRCPASWRSQVTKRLARPVPALPSATCCREPPPRSACRARCSSAPIPARDSWSMCRCWKPPWRSSRGRWRITPSPGHRQKQSGNQAVSRRPTANLFKAGEGSLAARGQQRETISIVDGPRSAAPMRWRIRASSTGSRGRENEPALRALIEEALAQKHPRDWEKILDAAGAPCASIWKVEEVIDHPQIDRSAPGVAGSRYALWQDAFRGQRFSARAWRRPPSIAWRRR